MAKKLYLPSESDFQNINRSKYVDTVSCLMITIMVIVLMNLYLAQVNTQSKTKSQAYIPASKFVDYEQKRFHNATVGEVYQHWKEQRSVWKNFQDLDHKLIDILIKPWINFTTGICYEAIDYGVFSPQFDIIQIVEQMYIVCKQLLVPLLHLVNYNVISECSPADTNMSIFDLKEKMCLKIYIGHMLDSVEYTSDMDVGRIPSRCNGFEPKSNRQGNNKVDRIVHIASLIEIATGKYHGDFLASELTPYQLEQLAEDRLLIYQTYLKTLVDKFDDLKQTNNEGIGYKERNSYFALLLTPGKLTINIFAYLVKNVNILQYEGTECRPIYSNISLNLEIRNYPKLVDVFLKLTEHHFMNCMLFVNGSEEFKQSQEMYCLFILYSNCILTTCILFLITFFCLCFCLFNRNTKHIKQFLTCLNQPSLMYDIFVSHSTVDREFAEEILKRLEEKGYKVCFAIRDFPANRTLHGSIDRACIFSDKILGLVSQSYLDSRWCMKECDLAISRIYDEETKYNEDSFLIVKLDNCKLKPDMYINKSNSEVKYINWADRKSESYHWMHLYKWAGKPLREYADSDEST